MIRTYSGFKSLMVMLFIIGGISLFITTLFWGITKASELMLPFLSNFSRVLMMVFCLIVIPLTCIKEMRVNLSKYTQLMSQILGVAAWMMSFLFVVKNFGFWGIVLCFLFKFLAPLAVMGALFKNMWSLALELMLLISFTYMMKYYSQRVLTWGPVRHTRSNVIDVEVVN